MVIKLTQAMLCLNCDAVYDSAESGAAGSGHHGACPACGSELAWPLSKWIRPVYVGRSEANSNERSRS